MEKSHQKEIDSQKIIIKEVKKSNKSQKKINKAQKTSNNSFNKTFQNLVTLIALETINKNPALKDSVGQNQSSESSSSESSNSNDREPNKLKDRETNESGTEEESEFLEKTKKGKNNKKNIKKN